MKSERNDLHLTVQRLREVLSYDAHTGLFGWNTKGGRRGAIAGCLNSKGYRCIHVDKRDYKAHRLAWLYVYGEWPIMQIDHANCVRDDNRISNLRIASHSNNVVNRTNGRDVLKGASFDLWSNSWRAEVGKDNRRYPLGYYQTELEAHAAWWEASKLLHGEFANPGRNSPYFKENDC